MAFHSWLKRLFRFHRPLPIRKSRLRLGVEILEDRVLMSGSAQPGFLLLDPSAQGALEASGNSSIRAVSSVGIVDSKNASAVNLSGHGYISVGELDVAGSPGVKITGQGKIDGLVRTGIAAQIDPLAALQAPTQQSPSIGSWCGAKTLYPGNYENGIHITGQSSVTMQPGVYYVKGGFEVSGQAKVVGNGVTIYLSDQGCGDNGFELSGQAVVTLSPATSGLYRGITIFQARSNHDDLSITGNATLNLIGTIYAAHGELDVTGNGVLTGSGDALHGIGSQFIGYDLTASGNGKIVLDPRSFNSLSLTAGLTPAPNQLADGSLVTNARNSTITGVTAPQATVALESTGDAQFNEGTTTADASGHYSLAATLADGPNTLQVRATANSQQALQTIQVTLDTAAPTVSVTSPTPGLVTNQNFSIVGRATDDRTGVASLQAALDGGAFNAVNIGNGGAFSAATGLPLDHTADGPHVEHVKATDFAGNVSTFDFSFTLDTVTPNLTVNSPSAGTVTNDNVTIAGIVADDRAGIASLVAALDGAAYAPVSLGAGGAFSFPTNLPLNHSADGSHVEHLKATDNAGNVSAVDVSFTLDTTTPVFSITSPAPNLVTNQNVTIAGHVTDELSGVTLLQAALDGGAFAALNLGAGGAFSLATTLPLDGTADRVHTEHFKATDKAGNVTFYDVSFTLATGRPAIAISSPAPGLVTNQNVTFVGVVTDPQTDVASLGAALDGGAFAPVSFAAADGSFSFATNLPLDHSADGVHTEHFKATNNIGITSTLDVSFTLDTVNPTLFANSPAQGVVTNRNVTIAGTVTDDRSGVASLLAAIDGGSFAAVNLGSGGTFSFTTTLPLDGFADGAHTEHLKGTDNAGNVSFFDVSFTLDTIAPTIDFDVDPASDTAPVGDHRTTDAVITLTGTTEPSTDVMLVQTGAHATSNAAGGFSFAGVPLALGSNTFNIQATDVAGNTSGAQHTITRDSTFGNSLVEGTRFRTVLDQSFVVPAQASFLEFKFGNLNFDTHASFIKDAFEASLTDANGNTLVLPIAASRDAFLNITEGQPAVLGPNARLNGDTVDVDLSHIPAGTQAVLHIRLVNNDADTTTSVKVTDARVITGAMNTPNAVTPSLFAGAAHGGIDFAGLADVSSSVAARYGQTSFNEANDILYAGLTLENTGTYPVDGPLLAVVTHLSDPSIHARAHDGLTPDGLPYFVLDQSALEPGQSTVSRPLAFFDPSGIQFTYDLVVLGRLNRVPIFTSHPTLEAIPGLDYTYRAKATDADHDALTFSLLSGPAGLSVDPVSGNVTWRPQSSDLGNQTVLLQVDDGHGGTAQQQYTVSAIVAPPNRPPLFTSMPAVDGKVDTAYVYHAAALDPDADALTFAVMSGPQGLTIDPASGVVTWAPTSNQAGGNAVTLRVSDGHAGTATQSFTVGVLPDTSNHAPVIVSAPTTTLAFSGQDYTYQVRAVDADNDPLTYSLTAGPAGMTIDPASGLVH